MRRQLNTLYVTTEGAWLRKDGANIVMEVEQCERARLPVHMLESLVCFGRVLVSPPLMGYCAEQGICTSFHAQRALSCAGGGACFRQRAAAPSAVPGQR